VIRKTEIAVWRRFLRRDAGPLSQFAKYCIAGGVAGATQIVIFFALGRRILPCLSPDDLAVRLLGITPVLVETGRRALNAALAAAVAFAFANAVGYALNVRFVFRGGRHHPLLEIGYFYAVSAVAMVIGTGLQSALILWSGMMTTHAYGANIISSLVINYTMRKFFIFHG